MVPSILGALWMGFHVLGARGSYRCGRGDYRARIGGGDFRPRLGTSGVRSVAVRKLHEAAAHLAKTASDILAKPEVARAMEQALVEAMVLCLADTRSDDVRNVQRHHARVMGRVEEALTANPGEPLYMAELSAQVGASYWTLRDCCLEYLGMSPKRYLWLRRMNLARRALRRANAEKTTVTEIAFDYGFWELGRFSVAYRSLFGESPATALRRLPDVPKT
jgi:AraC-like DNA-binding protein